jgi:hypothetical protein
LTGPISCDFLQDGFKGKPPRHQASDPQSATVIAFEHAFRIPLIGIDLPVATKLIPTPFTFFKRKHILQRIAEEYPYFVRNRLQGPIPPNQSTDGFIDARRDRIPSRREKFRDARSIDECGQNPSVIEEQRDMVAAPTELQHQTPIPDKLFSYIAKHHVDRSRVIAATGNDGRRFRFAEDRSAMYKNQLFNSMHQRFSSHINMLVFANI